MSKRLFRGEAFSEPYFLYLIFAGIGLGTVQLQQMVRLALLWTVLVLLSLAYRGRQKVEAVFSLAAVGRGALLGLVISVPLLAFLVEPLRGFAERLYGTQSAVLLFYQVCFVAAPAEEYFFRGIMQKSKGSSVSIALYAATALLFFLPYAPFLAAFIMFLAMGVLAVVYGYVWERHGLVASIACHVTVSFFLQVMPSLIGTLRMMLA